jgi:3D (Asp-Asp-Asp) domain-containing protein
MTRFILTLFVILIAPSAIIGTNTPSMAAYASQQKAVKEEVREATVFAYCMCVKCCGDSNPGGKTATKRDGKKYCNGLAADPKQIPYGRWVYIPGIGDKVVDDTGAKLKEASAKGELLICFRVRTHEEVEKFQRQKIKIVILED